MGVDAGVGEPVVNGGPSDRGNSATTKLDTVNGRQLILIRGSVALVTKDEVDNLLTSSDVCLYMSVSRLELAETAEPGNGLSGETAEHLVNVEHCPLILSEGGAVEADNAKVVPGYGDLPSK